MPPTTRDSEWRWLKRSFNPETRSVTCNNSESSNTPCDSTKTGSNTISIPYSNSAGLNSHRYGSKSKPYRNLQQRLDKVKICVCSNSSILGRERCKLVQEVQSLTHDSDIVMQKEEQLQDHLVQMESLVDRLKECEIERNQAEYHLNKVKKQCEKHSNKISSLDSYYQDAVKCIEYTQKEISMLETEAAKLKNDISIEMDELQDINQHRIGIENKKHELEQKVKTLRSISKPSVMSSENNVSSHCHTTIIEKIKKMQHDVSSQNLSLIEKRTKLLDKQAKQQRDIEKLDAIKKDIKEILFQKAVCEEQKRILDESLSENSGKTSTAVTGVVNVKELVRGIKSDIDYENSRYEEMKCNCTEKMKILIEMENKHDEAEWNLVQESKRVFGLMESEVSVKCESNGNTNWIPSKKVVKKSASHNNQQDQMAMQQQQNSDETELQIVTTEFNIEALKEQCMILSQMLGESSCTGYEDDDDLNMNHLRTDNTYHNVNDNTELLFKNIDLN